MNRTINGKRRNLGIAIALGLLLLLAGPGWSLRTVVHGNRPVKDLGRRWPEGTVNLANLKSRLGYMVRFEHVFLYRCKDTDEFNKALKTFAAIDANMLELVVHNGPKYSSWLQGNNEELAKEDNRVDWTFTVWSPEKWNMLYDGSRRRVSPNNPNFKKPVAPPRIHVYIGVGALVWEQVKVPENVVLIDKRPGSVSPEFAGKGLISAKVFDMDTKKPIKGAKVIIAESSSVNPPKPPAALTDKKGFCRIGRIPLANYYITVVAKGYASRKIGYYGNTVAEFYEFETKLTGAAHISGVVVDTDGKPIKDAKVYLNDTIGPDKLGYSTPEEAFTDEEGKFRIDSLPKGATDIRCRVPGMYLTNSIFHTYPLPSEDLKLVMTTTSVVRGKVYTKEWAKPDGSIHVTIRPVGEQMSKWGGTTSVKDDGTFEFKGVPPGDYLVGIGGMLKTEEEKKKATPVSVRGGKIYEVELIKEDKKK